MKKIILILFYFLISCSQSQNKKIESIKDENVTIDKDIYCEIPKEILNYISSHSEFQYIQKSDLGLLEQYNKDKDLSCSLIAYGDFNNNGDEDFALVVRYRDYKATGYEDYKFPFLVIFNDFKQSINPYIVYKTGSYKNDEIKTVIYDQFEKGIFSFIKKDRLCDRDIIKIIIPEKSDFKVVWNEDEKKYIYINSLDNFDCNKESVNVAQLLENNILTPEIIINDHVFSRDKNGKLKINTEILDNISKVTTRENSSYLLALENYQESNYNKNNWNYDDYAKIQAYIFNTTFPLRKKYWKDKVSDWYGGKPEQLLGSGSIWRNHNYYGLDSLQKYEEDFRFNYWE